MKLHVRMPGEKLPHRRRLVNAQVVENDVHRLIGRATGHDVFQEPHELGAGVPRRRVAHDIAGLRI